MEVLLLQKQEMEQKKKVTKIGLERDKRRLEQEAYMRNFEEFTIYFKQNHLLEFSNLLLNKDTYYLSGKSYDDYYICCFSPENYGKERAYDEQVIRGIYIDCTLKEIARRFINLYGDLKLAHYKRPLGLYLEYALVKEFDLIPNTAKNSRGQKAWDFKIGKEKIDLKISFFYPYKSANNKSIYNKEFVLQLEDLQAILSYITNKNEGSERKFKELLEKIKKTLVTGNN